MHHWMSTKYKRSPRHSMKNHVLYMYFLLSLSTRLTLFPGLKRHGRRKGLVHPFAQAFNCSGIPPLPRIFDIHPKTCDITTCTAAAALLRTLTIGANMSSNAEDLDHCLSYALQRLSTVVLNWNLSLSDVCDWLGAQREVHFGMNTYRFCETDCY